MEASQFGGRSGTGNREPKVISRVTTEAIHPEASPNGVFHERTPKTEDSPVEGVEFGLMRNPSRPRRPSGLLAYEYWICWALNANDGKLPIEMGYRIVFEQMKDQFTDREKRSRLDGQEPVWM